MIPTVATLIIESNRVLLITKDGTSYGLPAGRIEAGETEMAAAIRELSELTGLRSQEKDLQKLPTIYTAKIQRQDGELPFSMVVYLCNQHQGQIDTRLRTRPQWVNLNDLQRYQLLPNVKSVIDEGVAIH